MVAAVETVMYRRPRAEFLLGRLGVRWESYGTDNLALLAQDIADPEHATILAGGSHVDYMDAAVGYGMLPEGSSLSAAVLREGFYRGLGRVRGVIADAMFRPLPISRDDHAQSLKDLQRVEKQAREEGGAMVWFMTGSRNPLADIKSHIAVLGTREKTSVYPFVFVTDDEPIFPSKSSFGHNVKSLASRVAGGGKITYHVLNMPRLTNEDFDRFAGDGKESVRFACVAQKLEVLRFHGLLQLAEVIPEVVDLPVNEPIRRLLDEGPGEISPRVARRWNEHAWWLYDNNYLPLKPVSRS